MVCGDHWQSLFETSVSLESGLNKCVPLMELDPRTAVAAYQFQRPRPGHYVVCLANDMNVWLVVDRQGIEGGG